MLNIDVPADYVPSPGEIDNLVYIACKYTCDWPMRQCDLQVVQTLWDKKTGPEGIESLLMTACDYIWDHICGEPDESSPEAFFEHIKPGIEEWYKVSTVEERAVTETAEEA